MKRTAWMSILLVVLSVGVFHSQLAWSQYREEVGALEEMYETRARDVLNTILNANQYSVVVSVDIDRDEKRLKALEDELEKNLLPGMPGMDSYAGSMPLQNQLHDLKTKVDVHLILSDKLSSAKEDTAKALVKMKLHIDESVGDTLMVSRANLAKLDSGEVASQLPELSWKMWLLVLIVSLLGLAALIYAFQKKRQQESAVNFKNESIPSEIPENINDKSADAQVEKNQDDTAEVVATEVAIDPTEELYEKKKSILSVATRYPEATAKALSDYFYAGNEQDVLNASESLGWDVAKKVFAGFSTRLWGQIGTLLIDRKEKPTQQQYAVALDNCCKIVYATFLELNEEDNHNPFSFIEKISEADRRSLLKDESASGIAALCLYVNSDLMASILDQLPDESQEAVTMHIARLRSVPNEAVQATAEKLAQKLKDLQSHREHEMNGAAVAAQLIRNLPAEKEQLLVERIAQKNPEEALQIRQNILIYSDIPLVAEDIVAEACGFLDMNVMVLALSSGDVATTEHIMRSLPSKKAAMISKDLAFLRNKPNPKQIGQSQRELLLTIQAVLKSRGVELADLVKSPSPVAEVYSTEAA